MSRCALLVLLMVLVVVVACGCGSSSSRPATGTTASAQQAFNGPVPSGGNGVSEPQLLRLGHSRAPVPILMYHVIAPAPPDAKYAGLWVAPAALKAQVAALAKAGFNAVTLDAVLDGWGGKDTLPPHPIVLSFDDGYLSQGKEASTILHAYGWPGVLNLALHNLDTPGGLTTSRVKTMISYGWEVDAHSLTHPDLTTLDAAALRREVAGSRTAIHQRFGVPVNAFCYPAGRYNATVAAAVQAAGYRAATTELPGAARPGADPYALPRIRVDRGDSTAAVVAKVRAAVGSGR
ncbi:polysaccharide deacetylase family protein [Baekduia sp.]|uniref:polysaccharide deacetylase family protein n=1 Tax=Baekduia sp. TaxID=2600305 RepID=UPI002DFBCCFE|nr:polysaccharide deacetylase family protein [Baekduia sp.]